MADNKRFIVVIPRGVEPQQVDDFPEGCPRHREHAGALHISPGCFELTEGEIKHIRKHHKDLARRLQVVKELVPKPKTPSKESKPQRLEKETEPEPKADESFAKGKKSKK